MLLRLVPASGLLLAFACTPPGDAVPSKPVESFSARLILRPVAVTLAKGATQAFQAEINYPEGVSYFRQPVSWRVVEPEGGTVAGAGLYTAPGQAGIFHVQARRDDFPEVFAVATVTVK